MTQMFSRSIVTILIIVFACTSIFMIGSVYILALNPVIARVS